MSWRVVCGVSQASARAGPLRFRFVPRLTGPKIERKPDHLDPDAPRRRHLAPASLGDILQPRGLLPNCYQARSFGPANPRSRAKSDYGRYWARTSDLRLVESTCGANDDDLRGSTRLFAGVSGIL